MQIQHGAIRRLCCAALASWLLSILALPAAAEQPVRQAAKAAAPASPLKLDRGTIFEHLSEIMDIQNEAKDPLFMRWERPVRYYVQGLEGHPELMRLFEAQVAEIAKHTGLSIARHDDFYLEYRDESRNDRARWPGGLNTNAAIFFSTDMEASFRDARVVKLLKGFGDDPKAEYLRWKKYDTEGRSPGGLAIRKRGFYPDGLRFYFYLGDIGYLSKDIAEGNLQPPKLVFLQTAFAMVASLDRNDAIPSILNTAPWTKGIRGLTEFDKALLEVYYGPAVKSGMTKLAALLEINEALVRRFK